MKKVILFYVVFLFNIFGYSQSTSEKYAIDIAKKILLNESSTFRNSVNNDIKNLDTKLSFKILNSENIAQNVIFVKIMERDYNHVEMHIYHDCLGMDASKEINQRKIYDFLQGEKATTKFNNELYNDLLGKYVDKLLIEENVIPFQCNYLIAVDTINSTIFKLKGFQVNETKRFIHHSLLLWKNYDKYSSVAGLKKRKKIINKVLDDIEIEGVNIAQLYKEGKKSEDNYCKSCYVKDYYKYLFYSNQLRMNKEITPCNIKYNYCN